MQFISDQPRISGNITWRSPGGAVINANANYGRVYDNFRDNQYRDLVNGVDRFRMFEFPQPRIQLSDWR